MLHDVDDAHAFFRGRAGERGRRRADTVLSMSNVDQMSSPAVTCVMPFLDEARDLPATLASLAAQTLSHDRFFVIGVDNGSDDGSDAIFTSWLATSGIRGRLVRARVRSIPHALNVGIAATDPATTIVRLDAHTIYGPTYLETIDRSFAELPADVWCVGGAPTPHLGVVGYGAALGVALYSNPLGLGPADYRARDARPRDVTTVYLGAWRPGVLTRLGGFDERWRANEDCELTERIRAAGGRIVRVPVEAGRISTRGPLATIRQWSRYGFWRMQTFKRYPRAVRARHVAAPVALVGSFALLLSPLRALLFPLYALYALATIRFRRPGEPAAVTAGTLAFFPLVHVGYATGLLVGLVRSPAALRKSNASAR